MTARTVRFVFAVLVVAAIAFVGVMASTGGSASAAKPAPPAVKWGVSAQPTCQRIVDAGYAPHDYVLWGGSWRYQPEWTGANTVRMSWLWRSAPACLIGATALPPAPVVVQPIIHDPAPTVVGSRQVTVVGSQQIIEEPVVVVLQRREQEREYQASHGNPGDGTLFPGGKVTVTVLTRDYNNPPNGPRTRVVKRETKQCVPRDCLSGQEWYDTYGSEHPRGASYDPDYDPTDKNAPGYKPEKDPTHEDYDRRTPSEIIGDANYQFRNNKCWNGSAYVECLSDWDQ